MSNKKRILCAGVAAPLGGAAVAMLCALIENPIRSVVGHPADLDDAAYIAASLIDPFIFPAFVLLCWLYIIPVTFVLRRLSALVASISVAMPIWVLASWLLYEPRIDTLWSTALAIGVTIALPVLAAASISACLRPNSALQATCEDARA